jgi:DNA-directed RNA polymerase subunit RPC12/RpoP
MLVMMGKIFKVSCSQCNYSTTIKIGGLMSNYHTITNAPFVCHDCHEVFTGNAKDYLNLKCSICNNKNISALFKIHPMIPYDDPSRAEKLTLVKRIKNYFKPPVKPLVIPEYKEPEYKLPYPLDDDPQNFCATTSLLFNERIDDYRWHEIHLKNNYFNCPKCDHGKIIFKLEYLID